MTPVEKAAAAALEALHLKHDSTEEVDNSGEWPIIRRRCSCGRLTETIRQATDQAMVMVADGSMEIRRLEIRG